ncbi:MAG: hypothetical protein JW794_09855 [Candidatus Cloacimonetes bacterium]|nr:hypothetical protein [Candidatus Cloacimonadota bacterium]
MKTLVSILAVMLIILLVILFFTSCASTNLKIIDKSDELGEKNAIHYHCSPMQVTIFHDSETTVADLFLEFKKIGSTYRWYMTIDCSQVQPTWTELKSIKLELDNYNKPSSKEKAIQIESELILNDPSNHTNSFFVNNDFLKRIIHAHEVMITAHCNGDEAIINLAQSQINQIGMFYQYIQRNILNNASVIII